MNDTTRIFYLRDENKFPIATVATELLFMVDSTVPIGVRYAVTVWNPKDKFDKKLAHQIVLGRLQLNSVFIYTDKAFKYAVMYDISGRTDLPLKARTAAQRWMTAKVYQSLVGGY